MTIDAFLARLRAALSGMPEGEIDDILRELRSHVTDLADSQGSDVEAAIRGAGAVMKAARKMRNAEREGRHA